MSGSAGTSLIEMVAVLAILGVLSALAAPYARKSIQREKEYALRETLREVRGAIDRFHDDWQATSGGGKFAGVASPDGYPNSLDVLVKDVDSAGPAGGRRRYLRALPSNPFASGAKLEDQWRLIGYQDDPKSPVRRSKDVYDIRANTTLTALDGTSYADW
jgi:general secretion pathway protein G